MKIGIRKLVFSVVALSSLSACGGEVKEMDEIIRGMDAAEKQFNETQHRELVAFMSLETMFPDSSVRALARAAGAGKLRQVEQLVHEGVDVNARGAQGATPLFWAMRNYRGFKKLLELGADPNVVYADGNSVIHTAVTLKDRRFLEATLEHGGNPNLASGDSFGYTPIFYAMSEGIKVIDLLLAHGADLNARDKFGATPVLVAAGRGEFEIVYHLLERGADYTLEDRNGTDLAKQVATTVGRIRSGTKWARWQSKVIEWLRERGVEIPT